jgi:anti-sigma regulatory factor (Ser/Thr protein kinase)
VAEPDADTIHLSLPADESMRSVVEVAIGVLARRWDLSDDEVTAARTASGDALVELAREGGAEPVTIEVRATRGSLAVHLATVGHERSLTLP